MSLLRPKDGDYIVRGIFLLVSWVLSFGSLFTFLGGVLAGGAGAVYAFFGVCAISLFGFWRYLKLNPSVYPQKKQNPHDWSV
jgi:hypothetical protein